MKYLFAPILTLLWFTLIAEAQTKLPEPKASTIGTLSQFEYETWGAKALPRDSANPDGWSKAKFQIANITEAHREWIYTKNSTRKFDTSPTVWIKLGQLEIDPETAESYLLDCYQHPNKIAVMLTEEEQWTIAILKFMKKGESFAGHSVDIRERERDEAKCAAYNESMRLICIYEKDGYFYVPRKPSERDFVRWFKRRNS